MDIVQRAKNICLAPATEWPVIERETTPAGTLVTSYVLPLAAISAVAGLIGGSLVGYTMPMVGTYRVPIGAGLAGAIFAMVMAVVAVFVISFLITALAPTFGAQKDNAQAMKVAVYSFTPAWIAGALQILPMLSILAVLGGLYGIYLLYLGLPRLMKCPEDKAVGYTAVVVVCCIVVMAVIGVIGGMIVGAGAMGAGALQGAAFGGTTPPAAQADPNTPLGRLEQLGKSLEESGKKMEAAEKAGDGNAQVAAAVEGLGALLGGGKRVEPVSIDELKPFVPETLAGLSRTSSNVERNGIAGLMMAKAEAEYGEGARRISLEVMDTGGMSGLMGLVSWAGMQGEKEDQYVSERTHRVDGRLVHESVSKTGGSNEFGIVVAERFLITAEGQGVGLDDLKAAVSSLDLRRLEAMAQSAARR